MFTEEQAIEAIKARINGEYDNPELLKIGTLSTRMIDDIATILNNTGRFDVEYTNPE